jgi:HPr kinase/phosphorylase
MSDEFQNEQSKLTIAEFAEKAPAELELKVLAGAGGLAANVINSERIQKLGLALAGFSHYIHPGRVQIVGQSEIAFLEQLSGDEKLKTFANLDFEQICCILTTKNLPPPPELIEIADTRRVADFANTARQFKNNRHRDELFAGTARSANYRARRSA